MKRVCGTTKVVPSRVGWRSASNLMFSWRSCSIDVQLGQASQKTGFVAQDRRGVVIGVAPLPIGKNQNAGCGLTDDARNLEAILPCVLHPPIGYIEGVAPGDTQNLRSIERFTGSVF